MSEHAGQLPEHVQETDYLEQSLPLEQEPVDEETPAELASADVSSAEADPADVLEQEITVPEEDDYPQG